MATNETDTCESNGYIQVKTQQWHNHQLHQLDDQVIEEVPIALVYNGVTQAVMMSTPCDLTDFALGFSLSEAIVDNSEQIYDIAVIEQPTGYEINLTINGEKNRALKNYRRNMTGNTGCGLCGVDSLKAALRTAKVLEKRALVQSAAIEKAISSLTSWQLLQQFTGACHSAVWCDETGEKILLREDVGRHNALDKLIGAVHSAKLDTSTGFVLISSRASYEMIHKTSFLGSANLVAVSAPTSLAISQARALNMNLIGFARSGKYNVYHQS